MSDKKEVSVWDLRDSLKALMQKEIQALPSSLEKLEPKDRLNILCKLLPYVFPKVESVHPNESGNTIVGWDNDVR